MIVKRALEATRIWRRAGRSVVDWRPSAHATSLTVAIMCGSEAPCKRYGQTDKANSLWSLTRPMDTNEPFVS
jgi:hypothetical protein